MCCRRESICHSLCPPRLCHYNDWYSAESCINPVWINIVGLLYSFFSPWLLPIVLLRRFTKEVDKTSIINKSTFKMFNGLLQFHKTLKQICLNWWIELAPGCSCYIYLFLPFLSKRKNNKMKLLNLQCCVRPISHKQPILMVLKEVWCLRVLICFLVGKKQKHLNWK